METLVNVPADQLRKSIALIRRLRSDTVETALPGQSGYLFEITEVASELRAGGTVKVDFSVLQEAKTYNNIALTKTDLDLIVGTKAVELKTSIQATRKQKDFFEKLMKYDASGYASINVVFESATQDQARPLAEHTMDLFSNPPSGLHSVNLTLYQDYRLFLSRAFAPDGVQMGIASSTGFNGLPNDLLTPWLSAGESALTLKDGKTTKSNWSLSDVEAEFQSSERGKLQLAAPVSEFERTLLAAIKKRLEAGIDYAYSYFLVAPGDFQTTAARLVNTLPGFVNTGIFAAYRKGFDPYARPADLDSGRSVRYPLFYADLRSGSILQVDCLHRPKRGSVLDIQVAHMTDKKKPVKDLQKLLEKIEAPHEIWAGSFLGRWE